MLALALFILLEPYALTISLFERALSLHNLIAFASFYTQWRGLIGSKGIAPAAEVMARVQARGWTWCTRWRDMPTLAWISADDRALQAIQIVGMAASALAFCGFFSAINLLIAAVCYSSIKTVGGVFTGLQMHAHLMEINLLYVACAPFLHVSPAAFVTIASVLNWRVMMGGGSGKWYGRDVSWHNGTAMVFHYWTQPLPNPLSAWMHRRPLWMHKLETWATFVHESLCACFVFAPVWLRIIPFIGFESLMLVINLTGNYAQIGAHTMNESLLLLNDDIYNFFFDRLAFLPGVQLLRSWLLWAHGPSPFDWSLPASPDTWSLWNLGLGVIPWACFVLPYALVQLIPLCGTFHGHNPLELLEPYAKCGGDKPIRWWRQWLASPLYTERVKPLWARTWKWMERAYVVGRDFDLFGSYVKFGHMTKFRHEIIIEGSVDGLEWKEYEFKFKPSNITKRPPFVPFHLPALDWRLWFLPLESARGGDPPLWFMRTLARLLECEPTVMALFDHCPFDAARKPQFMRALLYDYRFRFEYEREDELKKVVREYLIKDTTIDTESEYESEEEEEAEAAAEDAADAATTGTAEAEPSADVPLAAHERQEGEAGREVTTTEEKVRDAVDEKAAKRDAKAIKEEVRDTQPRRRAGSTGSSQPGGGFERASQLVKRGPDAASSQNAAGARSSAMADKMLRRIMQSQLRKLRRAAGEPVSPRRGRKKVHPIPPAVDGQGRTVYWVRRHLIGPYGPVLAVRSKPAQTNAPREAWEEALEED